MSSFERSSLYDQDTFHPAFLKDLCRAKQRVIIESPFITTRRISTLLPVFEKLRKRNVSIFINTKPFDEHEHTYQEQALRSVGVMQDMGIEVLLTTGHHREIAIIDNDILYEGSLNILSQNDSCEVMRRICSTEAVKHMIQFIGVKRWC